MLQGIKDIDQWSARMRAPFVEVYGEDTFRRMWREWTDAYSKYLVDRNGMCFHD